MYDSSKDHDDVASLGYFSKALVVQSLAAGLTVGVRSKVDDEKESDL